MMNKFYILICLFATLVLVPIVALRAQKNDYVITTQGDTLFGSISQIKLTSIKFKPKGRGKAEIIYSPQAKEFRKVDQVFETKELAHNSLPLFLERMETGKINLYKYRVYDMQTKNHLGLGIIMFPGGGATRYVFVDNASGNVVRLFASKDNGPLVEIDSNRNDISSNQQQAEAFEELISDVPEILKEYNASFLNLVSLRTLINKYNKRASL